MDEIIDFHQTLWAKLINYKFCRNQWVDHYRNVGVNYKSIPFNVDISI